MPQATISPASAISNPTIDFGPLRHLQVESFEGTSYRHLYYELLHVEEFPEVLPEAFDITIARLIQAERSESDLPEELQAPAFDELSQSLPGMRSWQLDRQARLSRCVEVVTREQADHLLRQYAPTALLDACWLQYFSSAATSHRELTAGMLGLYSYEIGDGHPAQHHGNAYRDLLQSMDLYLPEVGSFEFTEQREILDASFLHPVFLLCLSQFPRTFTPEILGLTLYYYICGIYPLHLSLRDRLERFGASRRFWDLHALEAPIEGPAETIVRMVKCHVQAIAEKRACDFDEQWRRIRRGFVAAHRASEEELDRGVAFLRSPPKTPREKMIELIARRAHHAHGYHAATTMEDRSIDDWMNPDHLDPERFLEALARSRYVKPGDSKGSLLLSKLVAYGGPMFRIFPPEELRIIAEWIDSLPRDPHPTDAASTSGSAPPPRQDNRPGHVGHRPSSRMSRRLIQEESIKKYARRPLRELYLVLLNVEHHPDVRPFARHFARRWLIRAGLCLRRGVRPIPFEHYEHRALDSWLDAQHRRQVGSYKKPNGPPGQSREEVIDSTIQAAPMILIDGAWIQRAASACTSHAEIASRLFHIYADEVGNGEIKLNHPNVYRELLAQMGIELPEIGTLEFSCWPGFRLEAFRVPVFWLCISQFPESFLPETLGLNLAMELSGVGGAYRTVIDTLRYYGYDPLFVELHNSIDNVATGHTAWAIESIKCHMDELSVRGGAGLVEGHWRRVWTGFRSLAPPTGMMSWLWGFLATAVRNRR